MVGSVLAVCVTVIVVAWLVLHRPQRPLTVPAPALPPVPARSVLDERLLDYVVITLKSGTTFGGVLYAEDSGAVVLAKAEHVQRDGSKVSADGEIVILRGDVDFIQRP